MKLKESGNNVEKSLIKPRGDIMNINITFFCGETGVWDDKMKLQDNR